MNDLNDLNGTDSTDGLDGLLREHAGQWTRAQPAPPSLENAIAHASGRGDHRRSLAVAAAVVVVAAAAAVSVALAGSGSDPGRGFAAGGPATPPMAPTALIDATALVTSTATASTPPLPADVLQQLDGQAVAIANQWHVPAATATAVRTTYAQARGVIPEGMGDHGPDGSTEVWLVEVAGDFSCDQCPEGPSHPALRAVGVVLNAQTYQSYGVFGAEAPIDLSGLGDVVDLPM